MSSVALERAFQTEKITLMMIYYVSWSPPTLWNHKAKSLEGKESSTCYYLLVLVRLQDRWQETQCQVIRPVLNKLQNYPEK